MAFDDDNDESAGQNFDPRDLLRTARDYWMLALILAAPLAIGFYYWKSREVPVYRSAALILFEVQSEQVVNIQEVVDTTLAGGGDVGLENYLAHLRSRTFMQEVIDSLTDEERERLIQPYRDPEVEEEPSPLGILAENFGFNPTGQGTTVQIFFEHRNPEVAAFIVNRVTDQYTVFLTRRAARSNDAAIKFLMAEAEELRQQVGESDLVLQKYREDNNVISLSDSLNLVDQQLARVSDAVSVASLERIQAEGVLSRTFEALEAGQPIAKIPAVMSYGEIRTVLARINSLESEIAVLGLRYGKRHPRMIEKAEELGLVQRRLDALVAESREFLQGQATAAIQRHQRLVAEQQALEKQSLVLDRLGIEYNVLQRRYESQKTTYDRIIGRLNETVISSKLVQSPIRVIDFASASGLPIRPDPQRIRLTAIGLFGAVFGGIIGAFAFLDRRIRSGHMIEDQLQVELLGEIPNLKGIRERDRMQLVRRNLDPGLAEAFRSLCGKVLLAGRQPGPKTLLVTSSSPEEGKSVLCANLAFALHEQGKRVLLINADFRAPALDELVGEEPTLGSGDWYLNAREIGSPMADLGNYRLSLADGIDYLPVGKASLQPQKMLADERFRNAAKALVRHYDLTIVDAPPGLVFHDAIGLADIVTETIVVARYLNGTVARLKRLLRILGKTRSHFLGVVLNGVPALQSNDGYYRHARRYYSRDERRKGRRKKSTAAKDLPAVDADKAAALR